MAARGRRGRSSESQLEQQLRREPKAACREVARLLIEVEPASPTPAQLVEWVEREGALPELLVQLTGAPTERPEAQLRALAELALPEVTRALLAEALLLAQGRALEALGRFACVAHRGVHHTATYKAVARRYPEVAPAVILEHLVASTPGEEGKWFAAAKEAGQLEEALRLARRSPTDPRTLVRAARDYLELAPQFAVEAALTALHWMTRSRARDLSRVDVWEAFERALQGAELLGSGEETLRRLRQIVEQEPSADKLVTRLLGRELGLR